MARLRQLCLMRRATRLADRTRTEPSRLPALRVGTDRRGDRVVRASRSRHESVNNSPGAIGVRVAYADRRK